MSPSGTPRTFAELIARLDPARPLLVGADDRGAHRFTGADLRRIARGCADWLPPGAGVLLARAPGTAEAPLAALLLGLLAAGVRVYLPATVGAFTAAHLALFEPVALISDRRPVPGFEAAGRGFDARIAALAGQSGAPRIDLGPRLADWLGSDSHAIPDDSHVIPDDSPSDSDAIPDDSHATPDDSHAIAHHLPQTLLERPPAADLLVLTTSGSTGAPQALRYAEAAWMACGVAFAAGGLLDPALLGGPTVCPGLCHSMGVRAVVLAAWTGAPIAFVQPEWLGTAPADIARVLGRCPPRHITAGPALLGALPALAEAEPALRRILRRLRVVISSGAPFDPRLPARLPGPRWANAYGTSETQQISTTLLEPPEAPLETLGRPLPGVQRRLRDGEAWVRSPCAASGLLGGPDRGWWPTGDHIRIDDAGRWHHAGRLDDQISTGLGVELARDAVEARYTDLPGVRRLVIVTHPDCPGLLGLAFCGAAPPDPARLTAALKARAVVHPPEAPFEADRLWAVAMLRGEPPLVGPGKLDRGAIAATWGALVARLADPARAEGITLVDPLDPVEPHPLWPRRAPLQRALGLDITARGGRGDLLDVERAGARFTALDVVGGFGVNLLGHGDPELLAVARDALARVPIADQGAARPAAVDLCRALGRLLARETDRTWAVRLANTGAEAVDLALRHALLRRRARFERHHRDLERRFGRAAPERVRCVLAHNRAVIEAERPLLVTVEGGFHGTTLAARLVAGSPERRALPGPLLAAAVAQVPRALGPAARSMLAELRAARLPLRTLLEGDDGPIEAPWRPSALLAVFVEAVQGEGGVYPLSPALLRALGALDAPLIVDEIQAGLGRCGSLIAAGDAPAEVYLFGKALGGGLAKVAAVAIAADRLQPDFEDAQGSTFAGDGLGCRVARAVLDRIERDRIPERAAAIGEELGAALRALAGRWPRVIADVRGRGLLWGVELRRPAAPDPITAALAEAGWGAVAASWLLHRHRVRILPTTAAPDVLRIAPSVGFDRAARDRLLAGLDGLCAVLDAGDLAALIGPWVGARLAPRAPVVGHAAADEPAPVSVAFIHPLHGAERALTRVAPALARLERPLRRRLLDRLLALLAGAPLCAWRQRLFDGWVELQGVAVCAPPAAFTAARRRGDVGPLRAAVDAALALARRQGATIAVLGGSTSAVTDAGRAIRAPDGLRVVSGNAFTVAAILHRLEARAAPLGPRPTVAILGATGNLGRALSLALAGAPWIGGLILVGRPGSGDRLAALAAELPVEVRTADDPGALRAADLILSAVDDPRPLDPGCLPAGRPALWLDASAPSIVPADLVRLRPQLTVAAVGRARLPRDPQARIAGMGRPGTLYACAAEGLLLALDPECWPGALVGPIDPAAVAALANAGRRWGLLGAD